MLLAAWLGSSHPVCAQTSPVDPTTEREREAKSRYDAAVSAYQAGHYQQAIKLFLVADQLAPRAALAFNIAQAYDRLEDSPGALRFFREYLRRETSPGNGEGVRKRIAELEGALAAQGVQQLTVLSEPPGAFVSIDGQPRGATPWTGELVPGNHRLTLLKEGFGVITRDVTLEAARAADVNVELEAAPDPSRQPAVVPSSVSAPAAAPPPPPPVASHPQPAPHPFGPWPWLTLGAGGAALVAAGAFELARSSDEQAAEDAKTQIDYVEAHDSAQAHQTTARVLAGVGGALVVAGGVLVALDLTSGKRRSTAATANCTGERCLISFSGAW